MCPCDSGKAFKQCCRRLVLEEPDHAPVRTGSVSDTLRLAVELHNSGRIQQASSAYHAILLANPDHPDALQRLGDIAYQSGKHELAVEYFKSMLDLTLSNSGLAWAQEAGITGQDNRAVGFQD